MKDELERICNEAVIFLMDELPSYSTRGPEENHVPYNRRCSARNSNPTFPEYNYHFYLVIFLVHRTQMAIYIYISLALACKWLSHSQTRLKFGSLLDRRSNATRTTVVCCVRAVTALIRGQ
jgi:hypothetical protein